MSKIRVWYKDTYKDWEDPIFVDNIFAIVAGDGYFSLAAGDDGNWWLLFEDYDIHWLPRLIKGLQQAQDYL